MTKLSFQAQIIEAGLIGAEHRVRMRRLRTSIGEDLLLDVDEDVAVACAKKVYGTVTFEAEVDDVESAAGVAELAAFEGALKAIEQLQVYAIASPRVLPRVNAALDVLSGGSTKRWLDLTASERRRVIGAVHGLAALYRPLPAWAGRVVALEMAAKTLAETRPPPAPPKPSRELVEQRLAARGWTRNGEHPCIWYGPRPGGGFIVFKRSSAADKPYETTEESGVPSEALAPGDPVKDDT